MKLKDKLIILLLLALASVVFYCFTVEDIYIRYPEKSLEKHDSYNIFLEVDRYLFNKKNVLVSKPMISTGMFTDADFKNYYCTIKIPTNDPLLVNAWLKGNASICFESKLQKTIEWISNNYYLISVYYFPENNPEEEPIILYSNKWVGLDLKVSEIISLPLQAKNKDIYIKYESLLGSFLGLQNGNDVRFFENYLSVR